MAQLQPDELSKIREHRKESAQLSAFLGELQYQQTLIELEFDNLKEQVKANHLAQQAYLKQLGDKYGDGSINIETGEVTSIDNK